MSRTAFYRLSLGVMLTGLAAGSAYAAAPVPGKVFKDCKDGCPELVVLPAGSMGNGKGPVLPARAAYSRSASLSMR